MIRPKEYYSDLTSEFVEEPSLVRTWFHIPGLGCRRIDEVLEFYQVIKNMWSTHRGLFPCKGDYKVVRRMFVKYVAAMVCFKPSLWSKLPADLCKEMLDKVNQTWISPIIEVDPDMWRYLLSKAEGYTGNRVHPLFRVKKV